MYINSLVYFCNCIPHETTKIPLYELMFGRKQKLPIDLTFEKAYSEDIQNNNSQDYIEELKERIERLKK